MAFKKLDRAVAAADESLSGFTTKQLVAGLTACNVQRMCGGGGWMWPVQNPPLLGSVGKRFTPLFVPLSPEARQVKIRLRYECLYASVSVSAAVVHGPTEFTAPTSPVTLSTTAGRTTSAWITLDVTEALSRGQTVAEIALIIESSASATTATSGATYSTPYETYLDTDLTGTFNESDVLAIEARDGSGNDVHFWGEAITQCIRLRDDRMHIWPPVGVQEMHDIWAAVLLTRMGQLKLYGIEWQEVHGTPYVVSSRESFPWQNEDRHFATLSVGRTGGAKALKSLYNAAEYLQAKRTPVYSVFPGQDGNLSTTWTGYDDSYLMYPGKRLNSSTSYITLCSVPIFAGEEFSGACPIATRKALQVELFYMALAETTVEWTWQWDLDTVDTAGVEVTAGANPTYEERITPIGDAASYWRNIYLFRVLDISSPGSYVAYSRNNVQGLWDYTMLGDTGIRRLTMSFNDADGPGDYLRVRIKPKTSAPDQNWMFIVVGCIVRPPQTRLWAEVGD